MFTEIQLNKYADVLIWGLNTARSEKFKKGDVITVRYDLPALRLAEIIYAKLIKKGFNVIIRTSPTPDMESSFYKYSDKNQLIYQGPWEKELCNNLNGGIFLRAPESITHLKKIDPKKLNKAALARKPLNDLFFEREGKGDLGWTLCTLPTREYAKHSGLTIKEYTAQIVKACYLNKKDPLVVWKDIYKKASVIKKWLNSLKINKLHMESENIDLEVTPGENRQWCGISGHNIPSFEIFMSPDWRGTNGIYFANLPSYLKGNLVKDLRIEFKKGSAIKVDAKQGQTFARNVLKMDKGAARVGEFSLTDTRFSKINKFMANTLFDENFGGKNGNSHIAMGFSYSESFNGDPGKLTKAKKEKLGFNDSALHWDIVNIEKKRVTAHLKGGKKLVIYDNGKFKQ